MSIQKEKEVLAEYEPTEEHMCILTEIFGRTHNDARIRNISRLNQIKSDCLMLLSHDNSDSTKLVAKMLLVIADIIVEDSK